MAKKELNKEEYDGYLDSISTAEKTIENREEVKAACYETIEHSLVPIGVSGIEDLLQDNVFFTIDVGVLSVFFSSSSFILSFILSFLLSFLLSFILSFIFLLYII